MDMPLYFEGSDLSPDLYQNLYFIVIQFINSNELLENLILVFNSACLDLNTFKVYSYGFLFNCTMAGQASDSMTALT